MLIVLSILVLAGFATPWLFRRWGDRAAGPLALLPAGAFAYFLAHLPAVKGGTPAAASLPWLPGMGFEFALRLDGLALLFALLISGIGAFVVWYAGAYLKDDPERHRFIAALFLFMASMLGVVLADDVLALFVFWELTSFTSYLLIGHHHEDEKSRKAALQALLVTGLGGLFLLAGLLVLGHAGGSYSLSTLIASPELTAHPLFTPALGLLLVGAFTKSAQFPFHFWLPNAMAAPTPASAYLHSSTMVKAGVYLLARLHPLASGAELWTTVVPLIGGATLLIGATMAFGQTILKRLLAYTTVAALGAMTMLLGLGTVAAAKAAATFLLAHALYKAALFLIAGIIDHETGEKDVAKLGGLRKHLPYTAWAAALAGLSMMGLPPFFGFLGKELLYGADPGHALLAVSVLAGAFFFVVAYLVGFKPFLGATRETPHHPHEAPAAMWSGPLTLGVLGLACGLAAPWVGKNLVAPAASSIVGAPQAIKLVLWHGFNTELLLSGVTLLAGLLAVCLWPVVRALAHWFAPIAKLGPDNGYALGLRLLNASAKGQTRLLQSGSLRSYLLTIMIFLLGAMGWFILRANLRLEWTTLTPIDRNDIVVVALVLLATTGTLFSRSRMAAIASIGVVGYAIAIFFVFYGAPDLAMTQLVIETLTVILFVLSFHHLPAFTGRSSRRARIFDFLVAALVGLFMAALTLAANQTSLAPSISRYFSEHSWTSAYGKNIVNVILVDFRALDTLGEITVLVVAGIGVVSLLKLRLRGKDGAS
ncbi:MAG TPA: putative monovalent cation/H+ antiporter subunit A [Kiritimatiellia bacterium]|nr:putative monovalent cation/H+ antiporter subunit A [Kiritimatiellia bacterium]